MQPDLLNPKEIVIVTQEGVSKTFLLSKIPAIPARELVAKYPVSNMPKLGDYAVSEEVMIKLMSYVAVVTETGHIRLTTQSLINNHCVDWETLAKLEIGMMEYNCSFFGRAASLVSLDAIKKQAQSWITQILTDLSVQSSPKKRRRSTN